MVRRGLMVMIVMVVIVMMAVVVIVIVMVVVFNRPGRGRGLVHLALDQHVDLGRYDPAPVYPGQA